MDENTTSHGQEDHLNILRNCIEDLQAMAQQALDSSSVTHNEIVAVCFQPEGTPPEVLELLVPGCTWETFGEGQFFYGIIFSHNICSSVAAVIATLKDDLERLPLPGSFKVIVFANDYYSVGDVHFAREHPLQ